MTLEEIYIKNLQSRILTEKADTSDDGDLNAKVEQIMSDMVEDVLIPATINILKENHDGDFQGSIIHTNSTTKEDYTSVVTVAAISGVNEDVIMELTSISHSPESEIVESLKSAINHEDPQWGSILRKGHIISSSEKYTHLTGVTKPKEDRLIIAFSWQGDPEDVIKIVRLFNEPEYYTGFDDLDEF